MKMPKGYYIWEVKPICRIYRDVLKMLEGYGLLTRETREVAVTVAFNIYDRERPAILKKLHEIAEGEIL